MSHEQLRFASPPIIEVVFQVVFPTLENFGSPHIGLFWSTIRDEFPKIQQAGRLGNFVVPAAPNLFPENRVWLVNKSGRYLIQLQDDRFIFNWRKTGDDDSYPGYEKLYPQFKSYLQKFHEFLESEGLYAGSFSSFELNYINHIYDEAFKDDWSKIDKALNIFEWPKKAQELHPLQGVRLQTTSKRSENDDTLSLLVDSRTNNVSGQALVNFEIRISGSRADLDISSIDEAFESAHNQILEEFVALTTSKAQRNWK
jgi:uncharacterized protein (TIGR04255 family)